MKCNKWIGVFVIAITLFISLLKVGKAKKISYSQQRYEFDKNNILSDIEIENGWKSLFDGSSLKEWQVYNNQTTIEDSGWYIEDGNMVNLGKGKDLITKKKYSNFIFIADWKLCEDSNSGILYRVQVGYDFSYLSGIEYQIIDDHHYRHPLKNYQKTAACHDLYPITKSNINPLGYYNRTEIKVINDYVEHWLNGELMVSFNIGSLDWMNRIRSKYNNIRNELGLTSEGYIGLQVYNGSKIYFRNLKINEIRSEESNVQ